MGSGIKEPHENDGGSPKGCPHFSYEETFNEHFPYYLAIGMTYEQFWEKDCAMVKAYRKADEIRQQRTNEEKWLQGLYIYHAICDCLPSMNAFKPKKPIEYMSRPFDFTEAERERTEKAQMENNIRKMTELMEQFNKQRKGVGVNGRTD